MTQFAVILPVQHWPWIMSDSTKALPAAMLMYQSVGYGFGFVAKNMGQIRPCHRHCHHNGIAVVITIVSFIFIVISYGWFELYLNYLRITYHKHSNSNERVRINVTIALFSQFNMRLKKSCVWPATPLHYIDWFYTQTWDQTPNQILSSKF